MDTTLRITRLSIIMPVGDGQPAIREMVERTLRADLVGLEKELIIVDSGSAGETRDIIRELAARYSEIRVIPQSRNQGRGAAVARGLRYAGGDLIIIQDARLPLEPAEYPLVVRPILEGRADVVLGTRSPDCRPGHGVIDSRRPSGRRLLTKAANALLNLSLADLGPGCAAMTRTVADRLDLLSQRFGLEAEITTKAVRLGARVFEVPVGHQVRGPIRTIPSRFRDTLEGLWTILRFFRWEAPRQDIGSITLRRMSNLAGYNAWLHKMFESFLGNRILEVGSGVGNQTRFFIDRERVIVSDVEPHYQRELRTKFGGRANVRITALRFPLSESERLEALAENPDTVVCLNVLEHIQDDAAAVRDFASLLPAGGRLVLLVPAMPSLYGSLDVHLNHYRRYDPARLRRLVSEAGLEIAALRYLNRPGVLGWWLNSRVLKRKILPRQQTRAFRLFLPLLRREERSAPSFGMSLLVLARKLR